VFIEYSGTNLRSWIYGRDSLIVTTLFSLLGVFLTLNLEQEDPPLKKIIQQIGVVFQGGSSFSGLLVSIEKIGFFSWKGPLPLVSNPPNKISPRGGGVLIIKFLEFYVISRVFTTRLVQGLSWVFATRAQERKKEKDIYRYVFPIIICLPLTNYNMYTPGPIITRTYS